jgi:hypothetical protein
VNAPEGRRGSALERLDDERGAVAVLFALLVIVLFAAVAFVIDLSRLYHARQVLQNAVDFGALAGAQELPVADAAAAAIAEDIARDVAIGNAPQLASLGLGVTFRCVVGDRDSDGQPDAADIGSACGPTVGGWSGGWTTRGGRSSHTCNPFIGEKCNTIRLSTSETVPFYFAPVININQGSTGLVNAASCKGACGKASAPLDVAMVIDRTGSMTPADLANAKAGALAVLDVYDDDVQWVGVVALPYGQSSNKCYVNVPPPQGDQYYPASSASTWQIFQGLSNDYTNSNGTLNTNSQIVRQINCLQRPNSPRVYVNGVNRTGAGHTNLGDPLDAGSEILQTYGRSDVPDVMIFFTDGEANQPDGMLPCNYLNSKANLAKSQDVTIFTLAYGVAAARCNRDTSGPFAGRYASTNLAGTATDSIDNLPGGCASTENSDGDHYFCEPGGTDLEPVFRQIAEESIEFSHLVDDF